MIAILMLARPGIATSQTTVVDGQVLNSQIQLSDIFASVTLQVVTADQGVSAEATATSNSISATQVDASMNLASTQQTSGKVTAQTDLVADNGTGPLLDAKSSAVANTTTAGASGGTMSDNSQQTIDLGADISASTAVNTTSGDTTTVNMTAAALGNSQGWSASTGALTATTTQQTSSSLHSSAQAVVCCSSTSTTAQATSVANNVTGDNTNATSYLQIAQTRDQGVTDSTALVQQPDGVNINASANATGNNVNVAGTGGWNTVDVTQTNNIGATTTATGTLGSWTGDAGVTAYSMANSTYVANDSSAILLTGAQVNTGGVSSHGNLTSAGTGAGSVSSISVGNSSTAIACGACGSGVGATVAQTNSGSILAATNISGQIGRIAGSASAVGNSVTITSH